MTNKEILLKLNSLFPNPKCELNFSNNFELLIAVMLSAQCTDKRVNLVSKNLFNKFKTPSDFASADVEEIEKLIKSCGLYKSKARHIKDCCEKLVSDFNSIVPSSMESLTSLSGVGRKSANVVRSVGFNIPSVAVDTHVLRVSNRLGLYSGKNVKRCEEVICSKFDEKDWNNIHHLMVLFGRYMCKASIKSNVNCVDCPFKSICCL